MRPFLDLLQAVWPYVVVVAHLGAALATSVHVLLKKSDSRAAVGWLGLVWLSPLFGSLIYLVFGINRIQREARTLRAGRRRELAAPGETPGPEPLELGALEPLARAIGRTTRRPVLGGNDVTPLWDGDEAYPAMVAAIRAAEQTVSLCSYIFDDDRAGQQFVDALADAVQRGVEVRVLVDGAGVRYSPRPIDRRLRRAGVPVARFLPSLAPWRVRFVNLRNHRKVLVVDGALAFTGGMNIREGHAASLATPRDRIVDVHFALRGPVVAQLQQVFAADWAFAAGEELNGPGWFPPLRSAGELPARAISDGPDRDFERFLDALFGALACAEREVLVATPYFLPERPLLRALQTAVARGVEVRILVPARTNVVLVRWASGPAVADAVGAGCRVYRAGAPFPHTKLVVVDRAWTLFGSANWDPRSTHLNFELNVEVYGAALAEECAARLLPAMVPEALVSADEERARPLPVKLRDGLARLATPYL